MNRSMKSKIIDFLGYVPDFDDVIFYVSKKNSVARYREYIFKFFCWGDYEKELEIYDLCRKNDILTPQIMHHTEDMIVFSFIDEANISFYEKAQRSLDWLLDFHKKTGYSKGDQRLHNYLYDGSNIMGIDFEEAFKGEHEKDLASLFTTLCGRIEKEKVEAMYLEKNIDIKCELFVKTVSEELQKRKRYV